MMIPFFAFALYSQSHVLGIVLAIIASYVVGFLWHGPIFGKQWIQENKMTPPSKEDFRFSMMLPGIVASFVMALVQAVVMGSMLYLFEGALTLGQALLIATILWLPFTALPIISGYAWAGKTVTHICLDIFYNLVSMLVMAAVLYVTL